MSKKVLKALKKEFGDKLLAQDSYRGDDSVTVAPKNWIKVAEFLRDNDACAMNHFGDLTAVDWPERDGERFELVLYVRSTKTNKRAFLRTFVAEGKEAPTLTGVWAGANWAEREIFDMFGIRFAGHKDMRRILLYEEFEGHPLRKDYPIDRAQPLVEYRTDPGTTKLPPFGIDEGQPFARINWEERLEGRDAQVSPSIAVQTGQTRALSDSTTASQQAAFVRAALEEAAKAEASEGSEA